MNTSKRLLNIAKEIEVCIECQEDKQGKAVPGEGNPNAAVMFVGEAPGRLEATTGRPFIGRSGQLLRRLIREVGLTEEEVFITSCVKYLPNRGTPTRKDIQHGRKHLLEQIAIINPSYIVCLGRVATLGVLGKDIQVVKSHGQIIEETGRKYFITVHPAAALRFVKNKILLLEDFKKLKMLLPPSAG